MLLKMMLYQGEHHKMSNKRFESASTLANFSSFYYSSSTSLLIANIYLCQALQQVVNLLYFI